MLRHYIVLSGKVLLRRKFFTFISLFGISFTLLVLMVVTATLDHAFGPAAPETRQDRMLAVRYTLIYGPHTITASSGGFRLFDQYARNLPGVERLSLFTTNFEAFSYIGGQKIQSSIKRTDGEFFQILDFTFVEGAPYSHDDVEQARFVAVINTTTRRKFFGSDRAVGRTLEAFDQRFRVVGVVEDVSEMRTIPFGDIWVPLTTARSDAYRAQLTTGNFNAIALATNRSALPGIREEFNSRLKRVELPDPLNNTTITAPFETVFENFARKVAAVASGRDIQRDPAFARSQAWKTELALMMIGLLFVLLPAINLINLNVSRIMERASEIGVRMVDNLREERTRLREQHHFLGQILAVSPSGVVILDFEQRITDVNPAAERLLGRTTGGLLGKRLEALGSPLADALGALPPGAADVIALSGARRVKCHHGTFIDRGFPRSFRLIEELTEELRQFERAAYEKLVRVMSHEVNNSLAAGNSLLHSCLTYGHELTDGSRADFEQAIGIVIQRTEQLNSFMRRFADVFRLPPPVKQPDEIVALIENIVRLLGARTDATQIAWRWEVENRSLRVPLDRGQMEQALLNVLANAVEAIDGAGTITIRLTSASGRPTLTVEDTGAGLSPEAQTNLFTPFFSTKPRGQGIGLTLVQEVLSGHGFDYALERLPGATRFTIVFQE